MRKSKKMKLVEFVVLQEDVNSVIEYLGRKANFQIHAKHLNKDNLNKDNKDQTKEKEENSYNEFLLELKDCASFLDIEEPKALSDRTHIPLEEDVLEAKRVLGNIEEVKKEEINASEKLKKIKAAYDEALAFSNLKVPYKEINNLTFLKIRIGKIKPELFETLQNTVGNRAIIIPLGEDNSRILAASSKKGRFALDSELKKIGFSALSIPKEFKGVPDEVLAALKENLDKAQADLDELQSRKAKYASENKDSLLKLLEDFSLGSQIIQIRDNLEATQSVYRISGWISVNDEQKIMRDLDNLTEGRIAIRLYKPNEVPSVKSGKEKVPVTYKHNKFVKSFERIIFSYGAPLYGTIDPTPLVAFFFTLLFGIMFGDLGQGLVFFIVGLLMYFEKPKFLSKYAKFCYIFLAIGFSSMIMGFLTGEFFTNSHILAPASRFVTGLFGEPRDHILHLMPEGDSITKLLMFFIFTVIIGFIINSTGLIINIINNFRLKRIGKALFSKIGLAGLFFFWYVVGLAVRIAVFKIGFAWFDIVCMVLPLLCIFFSEPLERLVEGERPVFENGIFSAIIEGFVELLEVVSTYISNSVSFLRVGAFALSHAVLSFIVFTMAEISGGYLSYGILPAIIGNLVIILLEGLIVWIQVIRLQYYEFFSKFFTETGREFVPFRFSY